MKHSTFASAYVLPPPLWNVSRLYPARLEIDNALSPRLAAGSPAMRWCTRRVRRLSYPMVDPRRPARGRQIPAGQELSSLAVCQRLLACLAAAAVPDLDLRRCPISHKPTQSKPG
jgi:hypothetical protein